MYIVREPNQAAALCGVHSVTNRGIRLMCDASLMFGDLAWTTQRLKYHSVTTDWLLICHLWSSAIRLMSLTLGLKPKLIRVELVSIRDPMWLMDSSWKCLAYHKTFCDALTACLSPHKHHGIGCQGQCHGITPCVVSRRYSRRYQERDKKETWNNSFSSFPAVPSTIPRFLEYIFRGVQLCFILTLWFFRKFFLLGIIIPF